jgi:muconolactone delta-isomerase
MLFLVELDHVKPTAPIPPEAGRAFIEQIILPTLARGEQLMAEKKIVSGGAVVGRVALRFIVEAESSADVDQIITSLPVWPMTETRVTPLIALSERREHVQRLAESLKARDARATDSRPS